MSDVTDRLDRLEAAVALNQLPATLAILQRKLEANWQPDANILLQPGSVTPRNLDGGTWAITGDLTVTWPATGIFSNAEVLTHGFGRIPRIIIPVLTATTVLTAFPAWPRVFSYTATACTVQTNTVDAQAPGATATMTIRLLAIG